MLKVCGQDEYFVGEHPLIQYEYIQDFVSRDLTPTLVMVSKNVIPRMLNSLLINCVLFIYF